MDAKTKTKMVNALMTRYIALYEYKYGRKPDFNRYVEKWGFSDMLEDLGSEAFPTLEYYFTLKRLSSSADLLKNYHELNKWRLEDEEDAAFRRELAEKTKKRVEEYENTWHQQP